MQTIKTAVVVVLLLFVLYGGYVALNGTDSPLKGDLETMIGLEQTMPDVSGPGPIAGSGAGNASSGFEMFNSTPSRGFGSNSGTSTSTFGNATTAQSNVPPIAFPNPSLQPAPLLIPPSGLQPNTDLPHLASASTNQTPAFPSLSNNDKSASTNLESSIPISTNSPNLGVSIPVPKLPPDFIPNSLNSAEPNKPLPPLALPTETVPSLTPASNLSPSSSIKSTASKSYDNAKDLAMEQIDRGNLRDALATLSVFYNAPEITTEQRQDLLDLLDALTREVVFSRRHLLDLAYVVAPGETIEQVAKRYDLPPEILARINAIDTTAPLRSGEKLKVVPGPFRAEVDLAKNELTLFLGDLYAGRYPVTFGDEPSPQTGVFQVIDKQKNRNYYGNGVQIQATDSRNPFGGYWIDLGQDLCIHGSPNSGPTDSKLGCISLSPMDANDVFGMLSRGSQVSIRR